MTDGDLWLGAHCAGAPAALYERVRHFAGQPGSGAPWPRRLAAGARAALDRVLAQGQGRSVALDLLAADALITLALAAQAEAAPADLDRFAAELLGD